MSPTLTLIRPDDWHVHLRDEAMLKAVLPYTAKVFARAIIMPNLTPPITNKGMAAAYRTRILAAVPAGMNFTPLMTVYLTDGVDVDDLKQGFKENIYTAAKLYPAHATTNSAHGVTDIKNITKALAVMQDIGMPLLLHGEVTDSDVDVFDREKVFIDKVLTALRKNFPDLKIVLEHITTSDAVQFVRAHAASGKTGATITPHHLHINRNAMFKGGLRPHYYCLPVAKREIHRKMLVEAATSGEAAFFLGTDSAPHNKSDKESACGCAGVFCAPYAIEHYADIFESANALDKLEGFASLHGPAFYGLPVNKEKIILEKREGDVAETLALASAQDIVPFATGTKLKWALLSNN